MDFDWDTTPREAALMAENERLRAENSYLRRAVSNPTGSVTITPFAVVEEMQVQHMQPEIRLPMLASVEGALSRYGDYHVIARLRHNAAVPEDLVVQYHAPGDAIAGKAKYFVNEMFPFLHKRFITALANAIRKPTAEVA